MLWVYGHYISVYSYSLGIESDVYRRQILTTKVYPHTSPVANPISYVLNHVDVRSVLFFNGFEVTWMCRANLAWLPKRKPLGEFLICINPRWPP